MVRLSSIFTLLLGAFFLSAGQGLHQAVVPTAGLGFGFSTVSLSIFASVYFAGYLAGCFLTPRLIRHIGHTRTLAASASVLSILSLLSIIFPHVLFWILMRVAVGFAFANIDVVLESWLAARVDAKNRGKLLSIYRLVDLSALAIGQFLIATASPTEFLLFAVVAIFVSMSVVIVSISTAPAPAPPSQVSVRFFHVAKLVPLAAVAAVLHGIASGIYWGFAPVFSASVSSTPTAAGLLLAATLIGAGAAQYPVGWASDRFDRRKLLAIAALLSGLAALCVALTSFFQKELVIFAMFFFGATSFTIFPIAITLAFDRTEPDQFVEVGASILIAYGIGAFIGPLLTPIALHFGNFSGAFVLMAILYVFIALFSLYRQTKRVSVPEQDQVEFLPIPASTPVILDIDPRVENEETKPLEASTG